MWLDEQFYTCAYEIQPGSPWIGWSIRRLDVHRNYKIFVIEISNQHGYHPIPSGHTVLRTGDKLLITAPLNVLQTFDAAIKNMGLGLAKITETVTLHKFLEHESQVRKEHDMLLCYAMPVTSASPLARSTLKKAIRFPRANGWRLDWSAAIIPYPTRTLLLLSITAIFSGLSAAGRC